eukprot:40055-Eustigmatos_ZCMA.PRE.1
MTPLPNAMPFFYPPHAPVLAACFMPLTSLTDTHGRTPLMRAARGGHVAVVELLVAHTDTD